MVGISCIVAGMNNVGGKARAWSWKAIAGEVKCVVRGSGSVHQENSKCRPPGGLPLIAETTRGSFGSRFSAMGPAMAPEMEPDQVPAMEPVKENRRYLAP